MFDSPIQLVDDNSFVQLHIKEQQALLFLSTQLELSLLVILHKTQGTA